MAARRDKLSLLHFSCSLVIAGDQYLSLRLRLLGVICRIGWHKHIH